MIMFTERQATLLLTIILRQLAGDGPTEHSSLQSYSMD